MTQVQGIEPVARAEPLKPCYVCGSRQVRLRKVHLDERGELVRTYNTVDVCTNRRSERKPGGCHRAPRLPIQTWEPVAEALPVVTEDR